MSVKFSDTAPVEHRNQALERADHAIDVVRKGSSVHRDCGLSTRFDDHPVDMGRFIAAVSSGDLAAVQALVLYSLPEMAEDGLGLLPRSASNGRTSSALRWAA